MEASTAERPPPGEPRRIAYVYILPAFFFYAAFVLLPTIQSGWLSLFDWNGLTAPTWIGLGNYLTIMTDPQLRIAFVHALVLILFYSLLPISLGLLAAAVMSRAKFRGLTLFRTVLFLPQVIATTVIAVVWRRIYAPQGPLNGVLNAVGLDGVTVNWLGDFNWALPSLGVVGTWTLFGLCLVLFIAGIQNISPDLYDSAKVDGAGAYREFLAITLPGLRGQLAVAFTLTTITALRTFDLIFLTTRGGPGTSTTVPALELYQRAFLTSQVGLAAAIGVALTVIVFSVAYLIIRFVEDNE
jgi:raffinose/stachyose/melibiose transport system permease protein